MITHTGILDRTLWPVGPWDNEAADRIEWTDALSGFRCFLARGKEVGGWFGYIGVPEGHPWHGRGVDSLGHVLVHGAVGYTGPYLESLEAYDLWLIGFDACHAWDMTPLMNGGMGRVYRTQDYMILEVTKLAAAAHGVLS